MRVARVRNDSAVYLARLDDDGHAILLHQESNHPAADALREALDQGVDFNGDGPLVASGEFELLAPVRNPSKFLGVGMNYRDHALEGGVDVPKKPIFFVKTPNAIIGHGDEIRIRPGTTSQADFEVELAVIIGRHLSDADPSMARDAILGYTVCNDVTARDAQFADVQWPRSKSFDTFAPLGPWIATADSFDPSNAVLWCDVSGERMQEGNTREFVFRPIEIVQYLARSITLYPGDVITTGTPAGVGFARTPPRFLQNWDVVVVHVDGIGTLENRVVETDL